MENVIVVNAEEHEQIIKELLQSPKESKMQLINKDLKMIDPFSPNLTLEQKEAILEECKVNPMYFYDRVLGIKASRMSWDVIRTLQTYPKSEPGDHGGDMLPYSADNPHPESGKHYEDGSMRMADGRLMLPMADWGTPIDATTVNEEMPSFIDEWEKQAWTAWNLTLMHFAHTTSPGRASIEKRFYQEWEERAPEGVSARPIWKDGQYSKVTFEFRRGNGDWMTKLPKPREHTPPVMIPSIKAPLDPAALKTSAIIAWNEVVKAGGGNAMMTEAQLECLFDKEAGNNIGYNRVKVEVRGGEPSFFYRSKDQWIPL